MKMDKTFAGASVNEQVTFKIAVTKMCDAGLSVKCGENVRLVGINDFKNGFASFTVGIKDGASGNETVGMDIVCGQKIIYSAELPITVNDECGFLPDDTEIYRTAFYEKFDGGTPMDFDIFGQREYGNFGNGENSMKLYTTTSEALKVKCSRAVESTDGIAEGKLLFSTDLCVPEENETVFVYFNDTSPSDDNSYAAPVVFHKNGGIYFSSAGTAYPECYLGADYTAGHWYRVQVSADMDELSYGVRITDITDGTELVNKSGIALTKAFLHDGFSGRIFSVGIRANLTSQNAGYMTDNICLKIAEASEREISENKEYCSLTVSGFDVNAEGKASADGGRERIAVTVVKGAGDSGDIDNLLYQNQFLTDADGRFSFSFKMPPENGIYDFYLKASGQDYCYKQSFVTVKDIFAVMKFKKDNLELTSLADLKNGDVINAELEIYKNNSPVGEFTFIISTEDGTAGKIMLEVVEASGEKTVRSVPIKPDDVLGLQSLKLFLWNSVSAMVPFADSCTLSR